MAPSQLQIKANALNRLLKDISLYKVEAQEQQEAVDKLENKTDAEKADEEYEYELKNAKQMVQETEKMIPALLAKVEQFQSDLKDYISSNKDTLSGEEVAEAEKALQNASIKAC